MPGSVIGASKNKGIKSYRFLQGKIRTYRRTNQIDNTIKLNASKEELLNIYNIVENKKQTGREISGIRSEGILTKNEHKKRLSSVRNSIIMKSETHKSNIIDDYCSFHLIFLLKVLHLLL